jgi:transposase InsO family protein
VATRKEVINKMVSLGMRTEKALAMTSMSRSTYYYKPTGGISGKRPAGQTLLNDELVDDSQVLKSILDILENDFIDYGYIRTTQCLKNIGYTINKKKVYRLMKENKLLLKKIKDLNKKKKDYVRYTVPVCTYPFELLEVDIKYVFISGSKRNAYLITIFDVFTRISLVWTLNYDMKTNRVTELFNQLVSKWLIPLDIDPDKIKIKVRSDNGSQFISYNFREYIECLKISNEFIKPATPEQNGHIESFHSTVQRLVIEKYDFEGIHHAIDVFKAFFDTYNSKRIMKSILYRTPFDFFVLWAKGLIETKIINKKPIYIFRKGEPEYQAYSSPDFLIGLDKFMLNFNAV